MADEKKRFLLKQLLLLKSNFNEPPQKSLAEIPEEYFRLDKYISTELQLKELSNVVIAHLTYGKNHINYCSNSYLCLSDHPEVLARAKAAIDQYGTSVSENRISSGEIPLHRELEQSLAHIHDTEDALALPSIYATHVSIIGHLFGPNDLVIHDSLIQKNLVAGGRLSGAKLLSFPHNDWEELDKLLSQNRRIYQRVLIMIEGVYGAEGDIANLPHYIEIKNRHKCLLLVDEAHAIGVLGPRGFGSHDHFGLDAKEVDIWMGSLDKAFASSGGYIAGSKVFMDNIKHNVPGAVLYNAGISPANTGAALAAAQILIKTPSYAKQLRSRAGLFLNLCRRKGINTGLSFGTAVIPVITGNSVECVQLGQKLAAAGINVESITNPNAPESISKLRFIINSNLAERDIIYTVDTLAKELEQLRQN